MSSTPPPILPEELRRAVLVGLLKAANQINAVFAGKVVVTVFLRSDIYDNLLFDDQDKLRQYEEVLTWDSARLKEVVTERVRTSLGLGDTPTPDEIWSTLFSDKPYRSRASAEKYVIDRTFKRPRDIISFVRLAIEGAIAAKHDRIEPVDVRLVEEEKYSQSKFKDLIIENQKQYPYIKDLLESFSGTLHNISADDLLDHLERFVKDKQLSESRTNLLRNLFVWGVLGIKRQGRAGVRQRGGAGFYYYYDDASINPLAQDSFYLHPALRSYLNISEKREKKKG